MKKSLILLLASFLATALPLPSQEFAPDNGEGAEAELGLASYEGAAEREGLDQPEPADPLAAERDDALYVIVAFELDIRGRTRPNALLHNAELRVGDEFRGRAALEEYVRDRTQVLTNMRVLRDTVEMRHSIGARREDGSYPVTISIGVEDTWNVIVLPIPQYDSNTGFELDMRARDYNFLGTMAPLRIDLGYQRDQDGRNSFELMIDASVPFTAWNRRWNLRFLNVFRYRPEDYAPFFFRNVTGLSVELPIRASRLTVGFEESFLVNQENPRRHRLTDGDGEVAQPWRTFPENFQRGLYMSSRAFASWRIPTGMRTRNFGELTYTIGPSVTFNHELPRWPLQDFRRGPFLDLSHSLGFGRVNWHGNYRRGLSVSVANAFGYDFSPHADPFSASLSFTGAAHFIARDFFGFSTRLQARHWFSFNGRPSYHYSAGDALRGIPDNSIQADFMLSVNMDFPFRVLRFAPSRWFNNNRLRFFDFELHASPVLDLAFFNDPRTGRDVAAGGGLEFIVFPGAMRALYLRASVGFDALEVLRVRGIPGPHGRELFIGMGHFF